MDQHMDKDLTFCESEPIRFPGAVQPHGALLVLNGHSGLIEAASESCTALFGVAPQDLLGQPLVSLFADNAHRQLLQGAAADSHRVFHLMRQDQLYFAQLHRNTAQDLVVDIEPALGARSGNDLLHLYRNGIAGLRQCPDPSRLHQMAVELVKSMTGFDRVMLYRFDADANGEVLAEALNEGIEPYLGLHFPASDIPRQARELFTQSKVRHIPDAAYRPSALLSRGDALGIDLGRSSLRSVSPLHIEYLGNMAVDATLVGSLVVGGALWGLISCQHKCGPRHIDAGAREILGWLCDDIAAAIAEEQLRLHQKTVAALALKRRVVVDTIRNEDFRTLVRRGANHDLLEVVGADGFALLVEDAVDATGLVPSDACIRHLNRLRSARQGAAKYFASAALAQDFGISEDCNTVAGALFVSVPSMPVVTMVWFRREHKQLLRWGGDPQRPHEADSQGRISPRKSFDQFIQSVEGKCLPWLTEELESAVELGALIEIDALREKSVFAQTVLDSIPYQIAVLDGRGVIGLVNHSWRQFAAQNGAPDLATHSLGLNYLDYCRPTMPGAAGATGKNEILAGVSAVLDHKSQHFSLEYPCDSPDQKRWFRMHVYPMVEPYEGALVAHENITERKAVERALIAAKADAQKANSAKTRVLAAASHDLRQPLSALSLYVGVLQQGPNPDHARIVSNMEACCNSLMELLTDLLDMTKLDTRVVSPCLTDFSLQGFVASLLSVHSVEAAVKGLQLRARPGKVFVYTDVQLLNRICGNLLSNSIRYTRKGGILVASRHHAGKFWLEFWDTGEGIPLDKSDAIFEEFVQLGEQTERKGSGLGLAIVAKAAALLGLEIRMRSRPGHGSVFAVELPLGRRPEETPAPVQTYTSRRLRVGLVEDNAQVLESLVMALKAAGHEVVAATTGVSLLAQLGEHGPDVLISDYRLENGTSGFDVIRAARDRFGEPLPATIITGDTDPKLVRSMAQRGITIHYKPLRLDALLAFVSQVTPALAP